MILNKESALASFSSEAATQFSQAMFTYTYARLTEIYQID